MIDIGPTRNIADVLSDTHFKHEKGILPITIGFLRDRSTWYKTVNRLQYTYMLQKFLTI